MVNPSERKWLAVRRSKWIDGQSVRLRYELGFVRKPLAQWIAECHGTALTVHSQLGEGSCFAVQLPIAARPALEGVQEGERLVALRLS